MSLRVIDSLQKGRTKVKYSLKSASENEKQINGRDGWQSNQML